MDNTNQQNYFLEDPKTSDDFHCSYTTARQNIDYHPNLTNFSTSNADYSDPEKYFTTSDKTDPKNGCLFEFNPERQNYFESGSSLNNHFLYQYPSNVHQPTQQFQTHLNNQHNFLDRCYMDQQQQMSQRKMYYPFYNNNNPQILQKAVPQTMIQTTNASNKYPDTPPDSGSEPYSPPTSNPSMLSTSNPSCHDSSKVMYPTASNTNAANTISSYNKNNSSSVLGSNVGCSNEFVMKDNKGKIDNNFEKTKDSGKLDKLDENCTNDDSSKKATMKSFVFKNNKNGKDSNLNKTNDTKNFIEPSKKCLHNNLNEKQKDNVTNEKNNENHKVFSQRNQTKTSVNMKSSIEPLVSQSFPFVDPNLRSGLAVFSQQQKQHVLNYNKSDPSVKTSSHLNNRQQHYNLQEHHKNQQQYDFPLLIQQFPKRPPPQQYSKASFSFYPESSRMNEQDIFYAQNSFGNQFTKKRKLNELPPHSSTNEPLGPTQHFFNNNYLPHQYNFPSIKHEPEFGLGFMPEGSEDDSYSCDMAGAETSCTESSYRVISWGLHCPQQWCQLFNEKADEVVLLSYRVDADKGFNYAISDESFVCQKKNHFQITVHISVSSKPHFIKAAENAAANVEKIESFYLHFYGIKAESPNQTIKIEQSQSDRSKKTFHPVKLDLLAGEMKKVTVGRLHYSETTLNNMRKKGKPNPDQRYFQLVVALEAYTSSGSHTVAAHVSDRIIVRASNPGQFENDVDVVWNKGKTNDVVHHTGKVGINTDNPDEALTVHGNIRLTGHVVSPSDARAKTNIMELDTSEQLENIKKLKLYKYEYIEEFAKVAGLLESREEAGVLAQEVECVLPGAVKKGGDVVLPSGDTIEDFLVVNKERIFMENIGAVKELSKVTCKLNERIGEIELMKTKLKTFCKNKFGSVWSNASSVSITFSGSYDSDRKSYSASSSVGSKRNFKKLSSTSDNSLTDKKKINKDSTSSTESSQPSLCFSSPLWLSKKTQLFIILLIIIMTACLVSITSLYIIDRHNTYLQTQKLVESLKNLTKTSGKPQYKGSTVSVALTPPYCVKNPAECPVVCCEKPFNNPPSNANKNNTDNITPDDVSNDFNYHKNNNYTATKDKPPTDMFPSTYNNPVWWHEFKNEISKKKKKKKTHLGSGKQKSKNLYYNYYIQGPYVYINPSKNHHHIKESITQDLWEDYKKGRILTMSDSIKSEEMISGLSDYKVVQIFEKNKNARGRMKRDLSSDLLESNRLSTSKPPSHNDISVKNDIPPSSLQQESIDDPEMILINIVQTNTTLDTMFCVSDDCLKRKGFNFTYNVPISSRYPKAFLTIQFLPRAGNTAVIIEFCGEKRQESCEQYLEESIYSTEQTGLYTWDLPIGYFSSSQYSFRVSHKRQKGLCLQPSKSKDYMAYDFNFYRVCTDAL